MNVQELSLPSDLPKCPDCGCAILGEPVAVVIGDWEARFCSKRCAAAALNPDWLIYEIGVDEPVEPEAE